jgi:maltose 6'-phosphate phosphatase
MKLLTLNCHSWQEENQLEKIACLAETIKEKSYDVIALQEASQSIAEELIDRHIKKDNFAHVLLEKLKKLGVTGYKLVWEFVHLGYPGYEEGVAILTKHPIIQEYSFFVSKNPDTNYWKTRKIAGAKISYQGHPISFYSCHLGWWNDEEDPVQTQIEELFKNVPQDELFFLMGDFNNSATVKNEGYDLIMSYGVHDTYELAEEKDEGITVKGKIAGWDKNKEGLRIDLILSSQPVNVKYSNVIFNGVNKPVVSDHFGVEVEINDL